MQTFSDKKTSDKHFKYCSDTKLTTDTKLTKALQPFQLEKLAETDPDSVSPAELLQKLEATQKELIRWQALKRQETYDDAEKPESPAGAKLNFLKDSMFHYLTDRETEGQHLRAMVGILGFSEVQIRRIKVANEKKKSRKSSATK